MRTSIVGRQEVAADSDNQHWKSILMKASNVKPIR